MEDQQAEQQQQQQQDVVHPFIREACDEFVQFNGTYGQLLEIEGSGDKEVMNRGSASYLVNFIREDCPPERNLAALYLEGLTFEARNPSSTPDDFSTRSGMDVFGDFLISDRQLLSIRLKYCECESPEAVLELMAAFEQNKALRELIINDGIRIGLNGAEWGAALSKMMENNTKLETLDCSIRNIPSFYGVDGWLEMEGARALVPGLRVTSLECLRLGGTRIGDDGLGVLVDALAGNTKMDGLNVSGNSLTSKSLVHVTRLLRSTRIQMICLLGNWGMGNEDLYHDDDHDDDESEQDFQRFVDSLSDCLFFTTLEMGCDDNGRYFVDRFPIINQLAERNRALPSERQESFDQAKNLVERRQPMAAEPSVAATSNRAAVIDDYDRKLFHKAIVRLASRRHQTGASGILHLLQERPQLLETTTIATCDGATITTTRKHQVNDDSANGNNDEDPPSSTSSGDVDEAVANGQNANKRMRAT